MTMMKARKTRTTRTARTRTTMKAIAMAKLTPNLNVRKSYGGRAVRETMSRRRGEIEALVEKRKRFNNIRVRGKRIRGGGVDVTMLSQPRPARLGIVGCLTQESICFRELVHKIQFETGVVPGASGVRQLLEAYSTMGRAFAGGPPKLDEPFVGEEGVSELQLRRLNDMEMLIAFQNRLCVDMGCVIASGAASPAELCQDVKKYYFGEGFQRWECSPWSPVYAW